MTVQLLTTTTGDDSGTVDTIVASETVTGTGASSFTDIGNVTSIEDGERLFVAALWEPSSNPSDERAVFAFDAVNLTVTSIPEPSFAALLLVGLMPVLLRRRTV
jgi:hypothetical protein